MPAVLFAMKSTKPSSSPTSADSSRAFAMRLPSWAVGRAWAGSPPGDAPVTSTTIWRAFSSVTIQFRNAATTSAFFDLAGMAKVLPVPIATCFPPASTGGTRPNCAPPWPRAFSTFAASQLPSHMNSPWPAEKFDTIVV